MINAADFYSVMNQLEGALMHPTIDQVSQEYLEQRIWRRVYKLQVLAQGTPLEGLCRQPNKWDRQVHSSVVRAWMKQMWTEVRKYDQGDNDID